MNVKELPSDDIVEKAMLGAIMIDGDIVEEFFNEGQIEWFYHNKDVAEAIFKIAVAGDNVDIVSVSNELGKKITKVGGMSGLMEFTESATSTYWKTYSSTLKELYKKREVIKESQKLLESCYKGQDIEGSVENSFASINKVLNDGLSNATDMETNISLLEQYIEHNKGRKLIGWSWGMEWLDDATLGIRKGKTYRIGAPSGVGKTNLVYGTIKALLEQGAKVLFVSLENDIETTYTKLLSSVQGVNNREIETGRIKPDTEWLRKNKDNFILTDQLFDLDEIKREALRVKPDVVILDYIGQVNIKGINDVDKIYTPYSKIIKEFVQKTKLCWIDLSNLNTGETEEEIRKYGKFNGSASLKNNTDFGMHIFHFKPYYEYKEFAGEEKKKEFESLKVVTFLLSKNRLGPDLLEKEYGINFNKGINYIPIPEDKIKLWKSI